MENNYRIIVKCDPYNARKHYHGEKVFERNGPTPVCWLMNDNEHLTIKKANAIMFELACVVAGRRIPNWGLAAIHLGRYSPGSDCGTGSDGLRFLHDDSLTYFVEEEEGLI